jgi:large subunit ribosomal protein L25
VLNVTRRVLPLRTTPANIPVSIDADVTHLNLKDTISVEDIALPDDVECMLRPKLTLVIILEPRKATADEEAEDAAAAEAAEAAKPAADDDTVAS